MIAVSSVSSVYRVIGRDLKLFTPRTTQHHLLLQLSMSSCGFKLKSAYSRVIGGCSFRSDLNDYMRKENMARKQAERVVRRT